MSIATFLATGRLVKDPQETYREVTIDGDLVPVCNFTIAVNTDSKAENPVYFDCVAWRRLAKNLAQYKKKGDQIFVEGTPNIRTWHDDAGNRHSKFEVICRNIDFGATKNGNGTGAYEKPAPAQQKAPREKSAPVPF